LASSLHIRLFGDFQLLSGDTPVIAAISARLQSLLAYLILHRDVPQSRHYVAYLFWPDTTEKQALANLRKLLHLLRRSVPDVCRYVYADAQTLWWRPDGTLTCDVDEFERAVADARNPARSRATPTLKDALERAVTLYRGDLLPSCYAEWISPERERLHQVHADVLDRLVVLLEAQRDYRAAILYAQHLRQHDPLHEATYRTLMRLYAQQGDRAAALRTYHTCATVLRRDLAVEPDTATREMYLRLLATESLLVPSSTESVTALPLVGRAEEWALLTESWRMAAAGGPRMVVLTGDAGVGKTRLAEELVTWAARQGIANASARCYAVEGELPYAPVATWLRAHPLPDIGDIWLAEVGRLLPEVRAERPDLPPPDLGNGAWQRQRLFEALARALLAGPQPRLLFLDDMQSCDRDTLEWLHYLLRFDPKARLLIVGTARLEEHASRGEGHASQIEGHASTDFLPTLLQAVRFSGRLLEIEVTPLGSADTLTLAQRLAGRELDSALASLLYRGSEGNPLFVIEMIQMAIGRPGPLEMPHGHALAHAALPLPPKVRMILEARLARLSPGAADLAELAATIGREFTFAVLARASDRDESSLVRDLDELWRRRIIREQNAEAYDFSHDKLREVAYAALSSARRRRLHLRVAQALEAECARSSGALSAQVAAHYEKAGLVERAIVCYQRAAEVAQQRYAGAEALGYIARAQALLENIPDSVRRAQRELVLQTATSDYAGASRGEAPAAKMVSDRAQALCDEACDPA
jgi:DNA-binding SARP family transcriptional activator